MKNKLLLLSVTLTSILTMTQAENENRTGTKKSNAIVVERSIEISAPIDHVWHVSAEEFGNISKWDSNVKASRSTNESVLGGRVCDLYGRGNKKVVEELVAYDESAKSFAYAITEGLPGIVSSAINTWSHSPTEQGGTILTMRVEMKLTGVMAGLMKGPISKQMSKLLQTALEELKYYVETGEAHPRKSAANRKS